MTTSAWEGKQIVAGIACGSALLSNRPLSFLGDIDIRSGLVVEMSSDILGQAVTGTVLVIPATRGSAGAWRFLYQLFQHGTNPVAILTEELPDPSVVQGAIMSGIPIVSGVSSRLLGANIERGTMLDVRDGVVSIACNASTN